MYTLEFSGILREAQAPLWIQTMKFLSSNVHDDTFKNQFHICYQHAPLINS